MFFFCKSSKVVVDAFIENPTICEIFPIQSATKFYPSWWKELPKKINTESEIGIIHEATTMKSCFGFTSMFKKSFMIPAWSSFILEVDGAEKCSYFSHADEFSIDHHGHEQYGKNFDNYWNLKFISPWYLKEKSGINFYFDQPKWNHINNWNHFHVMPGILEFKYQFSTHVNVFVSKIYQRIEIEVGTPLYQFFPLTEKDVEVRCHAIDENEMRKIKKLTKTFWFNNHYQNTKNKLIEKNKCPWDLIK